MNILASAGFANAAALLLGSCGSSGGGACVDSAAIGIDVPGFDGCDCDVTLRSLSDGGELAGHSIDLHFPAACPAGDGGFDEGGADGACGATCASRLLVCTTVSGINPDGCGRAVSLSFVYSGPALRQFLGSSFRTTATCGGVTVSDRVDMIGCAQPL